jgi:hypothetical protein
MYPPWSSLNRLTERNIFRLIVISTLVAVCTCISVYTLRVVGPVRAAVLEHLDLALVPALGFLLSKHRRVSVFRGALLALAAALLVCWYDPGGVELAAHAVSVDEQLRMLKESQGIGLPSDFLNIPGDFSESAVGNAAADADEPALPSAPSPKKRRSAADAATVPLREYRPPRERRGAFANAQGEPPRNLPADETGAGEGAAKPLGDTLHGESASERDAADGTEGADLMNVGDGDGPLEKDGDAQPAALARGRRLLSASGVAPAVAAPRAKGLEQASATPLAAARGPLAKRVAKGAGILLSQAERLRNVIAKHERSSVFLAGAFLALGAWLNNVRRRLEASLATDSGISPRKLHALVLVGASLLWAPVAFLRWIVLTAGAPDAETEAVGLVTSRMPWILSTVGDHSMPSLLWYALVAAAFAIGVMILGEHVLDIHISGLRPSIGASSAGVLGHSGSLSGAAAFPGLLAGDIAAGSASASNAATAAATADTTLLRLCSLISAVLSASLLARAAHGSPSETSSPLLWVGLFFSVVGLASAGGLDASQIQRLLNAISRTGSASSASSPEDVHPLLYLIFGSSEGKSDAKYGRVVPMSGGSAWRKVLKHIWDDKNSRRIFIFLSINVRGCAVPTSAAPIGL